MHSQILNWDEATNVACMIYDSFDGNGEGYAPFLKEENIPHMAVLFDVTEFSAELIQNRLWDLHEGKAIE